MTAMEIAEKHHRPGVKLRDDHWAVLLVADGIREGMRRAAEIAELRTCRLGCGHATCVERRAVAATIRSAADKEPQ